jgi:O-antigen ligase
MNMRSLKSQNNLRPVILIAVSIALATFAGIYAVAIGALDNRKLTLVLLVLPAFLVVMTLKDAPKILFTLLVISLSFSARFRLLGNEFHQGGAELAIAPIDFPLFALASLGLIQAVKRRRVPKPHLETLVGPFVFFLVVHLLTIVPALDRTLALLEFLRLLKMALLVLVVSYYVDSRQKVAFVVRLLLLTTILQGALAVLQAIFHTSLGLGFLGEHEYWTISAGNVAIGRAGGTLGHANVLANFFEVLTPIGLALVLSGMKGQIRLLAGGAVLFGIIGTFLTSSRAGWASLTLGLAIVIFYYRRRLWSARVIPVLLFLGLIVGGIGLVSRDVIVARFTTFWAGSRLVRSVTAQTALNVLQSHPILGVGANNYLQVSEAYVELPSTSGLSQLAAGVAHNIVLLYGAELGLLGIASLVVLLLSVVRIGFQVNRLGDPLWITLSVGILVGIIALIAHGMWDWLFRYDPVFTLFWFTVGLLVAIRNLAIKEWKRETAVIRKRVPYEL